MIQNDESYKEIEVKSLDFSGRFKNVAQRNKLYTLYEVIESYNAGEFENLYMVGKNTVQELLDYEFSTITATNVSIIEENTDEQDDEQDIVWENILPLDYLDSEIEKYIYDGLFYSHFKIHGIKTICDILNIIPMEMKKWKSFGQVKIDLVVEFQERALKGEECYIINGTVKRIDEITPFKEIDMVILDILKKQYGFKYVWLCDWFGISRQRIDQKLGNTKGGRIGKWDGFSYTDEEAVVLLNMLKNRTVTYRNEDKLYYFLKNRSGNYVFLLINEEGIRCIFDKDVVGELKEYILSNRLNELDLREIDILSNGREISILRTIYFMPDKEDMTHFNAYAKKRGMSKEEYGKFLSGKPYTNEVNITDNTICKFFDEHLNEEGRVYISSDPSNQWIRSYVYRNGYKMSEFIEFYGYKTALPGDRLTTEGAKRRHLEKIKKYIIYDNVVYIPTSSDFYRILNSYSSRKHISVSDYIEELGYERSLIPREYSNTDFSNQEVVDFDEKDMEVYKSDGSFIEKIFAKNPLLGSYVFSDNNLRILHNNAKNIIDNIVIQQEAKISKEQKMQVALSVINYAKNWDTGLGAFSSYITKQYGYRSEDRVYSKIMAATFDAIKNNNRWTFSSHGSNQYKSTVMIHAMGSIRSWMYLCDFLSDFYQNNLGCRYVENDPYVLSMVMYIRGLFYSSELGIEDDNYEEFTVGSKPYRFQEGIRKLVVYRPNYAAKVFDRMIKRIHGYMNSDVLPAEKYEEALVDIWFKKKTEYYFKFKRNREKKGSFESHRIAFEYSHIRLEYRFYENDIWIDVPDIRLEPKSSEVCYFEVYDGETVIEKKSLKCYGNELGKTIAGFTYPLKDYLSIKEFGEISPRIVIKCGESTIYDSQMKLKRRIIFFDGEREKDISAVEVGEYVVFASSEVDITGVEVKTSFIKTIEGYKYIFVELEDDYSLVVDDIIVSFDRKRVEKISVNLPHYVSGAKYIENGLDYSICKSNGDISIVVDEKDIEQKYVILLNGKQISFSDLKLMSGEGINVYTLPVQVLENKKNRLQIVDFSSSKLVVDKWFVFIPSFEFAFDSDYYFTETEVQNCCVEYSIDGEDYEIVNNNSDYCLSAEYGDGEILFEIPRIKLQDIQGNEWKKKEYFIDEIDRGLYLKLCSISGIEGKIYVDNVEIQRDVMGMYTLGNTLHSLLDSKTKIIKLILINHSGEYKTYNLGKVIFKEQFITKPKLEYLDGSIVWDGGYGFIGNTKKETFLRIEDELGSAVFDSIIDFEATILVEDINVIDGEYHYIIYRESGDLFSLVEDNLAEGVLVCGNYDKIRFNNSRIVITQIIFDNAMSSGVVSIIPAYIDNIRYDAELSKKESSEGVCPTYFGTMYFINPEGKRHDFAFEDENRSETDIRLKTNPVKIVYINESVLLITDADNDALLYRFYYDRYTHEKKYYITDHKPSTFNEKYYDSVDLLRYKKEKL